MKTEGKSIKIRPEYTPGEARTWAGKGGVFWSCFYRFSLGFLSFWGPAVQGTPYQWFRMRGIPLQLIDTPDGKATMKKVAKVASP